MPRDKIIMAFALVLLSLLILTAIPVKAAADASSTVLLQEDAEEATYDEWNSRWQRSDINSASGEDSICRTTHNAHESAHGIYASRNGFNSHYLAPVTMADGSTGYTQPWNVNITAIPASAGAAQSQYVMRYDTNQTSVMRKAVVGASNYAEVSLSFWFWSDTGASDAKQPLNGTTVGYDFLNVLYYTGSGDALTKHVLWTDTEVQASAKTWIYVTVKVPTDVTAVGFEFVSGTVAPQGGDASDAFSSSGVKIVNGGMREGVYLDDIVVTGSEATADIPVTTSVDNLALVQGSRTFGVGFTANQPTAGFSHVNLYYREGSSGDWTKYAGDFTTSPISFTAAGDGRYEFFTQGFDDSGASEALRTAADAATIVDTVDPGTTISVSGTSTGENTYSGSASFTLTAIDGGSGLNATYYRVDSSSWIRYNGEVTLTNGGSHHVQYYSDDLAGNVEAVKARTVTIETSNPVVTFLDPEKEYSSSTATVRFQVDSSSSIAELRASLDGEANSTIDAGLSSVTFTDLTAGTHRVTIWARDSSDRWGQNMTAFTVVPGSSPGGTTGSNMTLILGSLSPSYSVGDTVHLTWNCTITDGQIDHFTVLVDSAVVATLTGSATVYDLTDLSAGSHEITVLAVDGNGNTTEKNVILTVKASGSASSGSGIGISQDMIIIGGIALFGVIAAGVLIFLRSRKMY
jgi:hypothetical protein